MLLQNCLVVTRKRIDAKMKLIILNILLTAALVTSTPSIKFMDDRVYTTKNIRHTGQNEISKVHLPAVLIDKNIMFFVEADLIKKQHKGLYVQTINDKGNSTARKLLDNGKCVTSDADTVYFGTTDGIYTYNVSTDTAEKFGSITADIKEIEKEKGEGKDLIYVVTEDNQLYTVTEKGNKMTRHQTIKNVAEIALDVRNNLYFYEIHEDPDHYQPFYVKYGKPKVLVGGNVIEIVGLPDKYTNMKLADTLIAECAIAVINNKLYLIYPNGTSIDTGSMFLDLPTAYSIEIGLVELFAHDKKIYLLSVLDQLDFQKAITAALTGVLEMFAKAIEQFHF